MTLRFLSAVAALSIFATAAVAVPANDLIDDAFALTPPSGSVLGTTVDATLDAGTPFVGTSVTAPGVWYTAFGSGETAIFDTCGTTGYDSKINVYSDYDGSSLASMVGVAGNDDYCGLQSRVSFDSQLGTKYWIVVSGFGSATGNFELNYSGIAGTSAAVPLPAGVVLLLSALGGLGLARSRAAQSS